MTPAETWLRDRMTVRRWLAVLCGVAVLAVVVAAVAVAALRPSDDAAAADDAAPPAAAGQRPASLDLQSTVGSFSDLDGRAAVTLDVFPAAVPVRWTVTIRGLTAGGGVASPREIDLSDGEVRAFAAALDDAVRHPDPDTDATVGGATIHAVDVGPGEFHYDLRSVGALRLDADGMADLKRLLDRADAQRAWIVPRTAALRTTTAGPDPTAGHPPTR